MCPGPAAPAPSPARPTMDISASIRDTWESPATPGPAAASSQRPGRGMDRGCGATAGRGRAGHTTAAASAQTSVSGGAMGRFQPREASFAAIAALPSALARLRRSAAAPPHHRGPEEVICHDEQPHHEKTPRESWPWDRCVDPGHGRRAQPEFITNLLRPYHQDLVFDRGNDGMSALGLARHPVGFPPGTVTPAYIDLPVVVPRRVQTAAAIDGHRGIEPILRRGGDRLLAAPSLRALGEVDAAATGIPALPDDDRGTVRSSGQRDGHRILAPRRDGLGWRPGAVVHPCTIRGRAQCVAYLIVSQIELVPSAVEPTGAVNHQRRIDGVGDAGADDFRLAPPVIAGGRVEDLVDGAMAPGDRRRPGADSIPDHVHRPLRIDRQGRNSGIGVTWA